MEHNKKYHDIWRWKSPSNIRTGTIRSWYQYYRSYEIFLRSNISFFFLRVLSSDSYCLCSYEISLRIYIFFCSDEISLRIYIFFCSDEISLRIYIVFVLASSLSAMLFYLFLWVLSPEWYCLCSFVNGQSLLMSFIIKTVKMILLGDIWEKDIPTNQQSYW
jgi:hypothetical protein